MRRAHGLAIGLCILALTLSAGCRSDVAPGSPASPHTSTAADPCSSLDARLLPEDHRIPWAAAWKDIRIRPGGQGVALVSHTNFFQSIRGEQLREDVVDRGRDWYHWSGVHLVEWDETGAAIHHAPEDALGTPDARGSWSSDGGPYAHVFWTDGARRLSIFDMRRKAWSTLDATSTRLASNPAFQPGESMVAMIAIDLDESATNSLRGMAALENQTWNGSLETIDATSGAVTRTELAAWHGAFVPHAWLSWRPDGQLIAAAVFAKPLLHTVLQLFIVDPTTLRTISSRQIDADEWRSSVPQWSPDGSHVAIGCMQGLVDAEVSPGGGLGRTNVEADLAGSLQCAWVPGSTDLLVVEQSGAPDLGEVMKSIRKMGENVTHREAYSPAIHDASTQRVFHCGTFGVAVRESWDRAYMLPRVAESVAKREQ
jgi:hypothetical protein